MLLIATPEDVEGSAVGGSIDDDLNLDLDGALLTDLCTNRFVCWLLPVKQQQIQSKCCVQFPESLQHASEEGGWGPKLGVTRVIL